MSQEVARLEELLARVQRNAALPRTLPAAFAAVPAPSPPAPVVFAPPPAAPVFAAPEVAFDPEPLQPEFEAPLPYPPVGDHEARQVQPAALDQSVDDMLLADPFPSVAPAPPAQQSLTDMLDEDASPHVSVSGQQVAPGEDISGVMNRSDLADEPPEELLEDDIVEMTSGEAEAVVPAGNSLDDLNFDDEELSGGADRDRQSEEPPASSSRHKVAGTMDEALARAAEQIEHDEDREVPLKTPPPESGPQAAMALPVGIHAPLAPDIEELLEADILPVGGVHADLPTTEQLGQTIELEEARGPHLELDSALAAAPQHHEQPHEELEVTLPAPRIRWRLPRRSHAASRGAPRSRRAPAAFRRRIGAASAGVARSVSVAAAGTRDRRLRAADRARERHHRFSSRERLDRHGRCARARRVCARAPGAPRNCRGSSRQIHPRRAGASEHVFGIARRVVGARQ